MAHHPWGGGGGVCRAARSLGLPFYSQMRWRTLALKGRVDLEEEGPVFRTQFPPL